MSMSVSGAQELVNESKFMKLKSLKHKGRVSNSTLWPTTPKNTLDHVHRIKRRLSFMIVLGYRNSKIAKELGMSINTIKRYLDLPEVQESIQEMSQEIYERAERQYQALFLKSISRTASLIDRGHEDIALEAIKMVLTSLGRYNPKPSPGETTIYNQMAMMNQGPALEREDAKSILELLREKREQAKREHIPNLEKVET